MARNLYSLEDGELTLHFDDHDGQSRAWNSTKRFVFVMAGTQGGKTSFGPWWLWREIKNTAVPGELNDYLVVTATYELFTRKILPEMTSVFGDLLGIGRYWGTNRTIELRENLDPSAPFLANNANDKMFARIMLISATAGGKAVGVKALESATAKAAWLDECGLDEFPQVAWEAVNRRISIARGRVLGTTTLYNFDWMYHQIYVPWEAGDPDIDVVQFDSIENPIFPIEEYERAKRILPGWKFDMLYRGIFTRPAGMIYQDYDESVHVVDPFPIPSAWSLYIGIDPGAVNTAMIWIAVDPHTKREYVFRESLQGNMTTEEHAKRLNELLHPFKGSVRIVGGCASEKQFRMDLQSAGIPVQAPPIDAVESGIDRVTARLKSGKFFIFRTCPMLRGQMREYSRELDQEGQPTEKIKNKEKYHALDALRYGVSRMPLLWVQGIPLQNATTPGQEVPTMMSRSKKVPKLM